MQSVSQSMLTPQVPIYFIEGWRRPQVKHTQTSELRLERLIRPHFMGRPENTFPTLPPHLTNHCLHSSSRNKALLPVLPSQRSFSWNKRFLLKIAFVCIGCLMEEDVHTVSSQNSLPWTTSPAPQEEVNQKTKEKPKKSEAKSSLVRF